jgi:hypothetical protein
MQDGSWLFLGHTPTMTTTSLYRRIPFINVRLRYFKVSICRLGSMNLVRPAISGFLPRQHGDFRQGEEVPPSRLVSTFVTPTPWLHGNYVYSGHAST